MTASVTVNGERRALPGLALHTNLLDALRGLGLTGAKEGCAEGECGACAVLVARPALDGSATTDWVAVNSCLVPAVTLDGQEVVTSEGLGAPGSLHPVQREMAERGGSQCGYCTPGFVCSMAAEFYRPGRSHVVEEGSEDGTHGHNGFDLHSISGNLCRCTGYRPIRDAAFALGHPGEDDPLAVRRAEATPSPGSRRIDAAGRAFVRPASLDEALALLRAHPGAAVVAGSTDWGVDVNLRGRRPDLLVAIDRLPELRGFSVGRDEIRFGAALTLSELARRVEGRLPLVSELLPQFASPLIRNSATVGGNLGTGSPIGDVAPVLLALDAEVVLASVDGERAVALADYFTGYRDSVRSADELITEVVVPMHVGSTTGFHKIAKRRFDDISSVAVAFVVDVVDGVVTRARIGLGGVAAMPVRARRTEAALEGRRWSIETIEAAATVLAKEGTPLSDQRASAEYRAAMLGQSLRRLFHEAMS